VDLVHVADFGERDLLRRLVEQHARFTGSARAKRELNHWDRAMRSFYVVVPREYRKVLDRQAEAVATGTSSRHGMSVLDARSARHG
jgi:glutamate synthase (NADPH/NADH) large chain